MKNLLERKEWNLGNAARLALVAVLLIIVLVSGLLNEPTLIALMKNGIIAVLHADLAFAVRLGMVISFVWMIDRFFPAEYA